MLDSGPLGMVTHPRGDETTARCRAWLDALLANGADVRIPDICDYEVRRELLRAGRTAGLRRLDQLRGALEVVEISTRQLMVAAALWADARQTGQPTAGNRELDGDMILVAQARQVAEASGKRVVLATTNVGHLARFADARLWHELTVS